MRKIPKIIYEERLISSCGECIYCVPYHEYGEYLQDICYQTKNPVNIYREINSDCPLEEVPDISSKRIIKKNRRRI